MNNTIVLEATWTSTKLQQILPAFLDEYWATERGFSDATLDISRDGTPYGRKRVSPDMDYFRDFIWNDEPADMQAALHNAIHPLFQPANFLTYLPRGEVLEQLCPALRLATMFITHDCALQWFAHVRFSEETARTDGVKMLKRPAGSITSEQLSIVKYDLLALTEKLKFTWGSGSYFASIKGLTLCRASGVAGLLYSCTYKKPPSDAARTALLANDDDWYPFVFLHIDFFYRALQYCHHGATRAQLESFQFELATLLVHELAHVWMAFCHPVSSASGPCSEPLACPCDAFPEAGFSWEQSIFGASLHPSQFEDVLFSRTFASHFRAPRHHLTSYVPQAYVSQWFLQSTWTCFGDLHSAGKLFAPSPDRQTSQFQLLRFCKTKKSCVIVIYINGFVAPLQRCCSEPNCGMANPGNSIPWPAQPEELFRVYMDVMQHDIKAASNMGVEYNPMKLEKDRVPKCYALAAKKMDAFEFPIGYRVVCGVVSAAPEKVEKSKKSETQLGSLGTWLARRRGAK
jgi:hypothetical protein